MRTSLLLLLALTSGACAFTSRLPTLSAAAPLSGAVDTHLHLTMAQAAGPLFRGEPGEGALSTDPGNRWVNMVDAPSLAAGGVHLVYGALWPPPRVRPDRTALEEALHQLDALDDFTRRRPRFSRVLTAAEARRAMRRGAIAVLPQLEGGESIGSVEDVDRLYAAGMRCLTLVHFVSTGLGGAAAGQLARAFLHADVRGRSEPEGLSPLGRQVVQRLLDLGVVIDLAHASDAMAAEVLALTEARGVPVLVSHTGARALSGMERNLPDALARRVVAGGGLVSVSLFADQLAMPVSDARPWPGYQPGTCDDVVAHWLHFSALLGEEAVLLGSDFNGPVNRAAPGGLCPSGLANSGSLGELWAALVARGANPARLGDQASRLLTLVERAEAAADPSAQRRALVRR